MNIDLYQILKEGIIKQTNRCEDDVYNVLDDNEISEMIEELEEEIKDKFSKIELNDKDYKRMFDSY